MNVLIVGAGVIGTVYGAHLGCAGHAISVLAHGDRTTSIAAGGLQARDIISGVESRAPARVVACAGATDADVVLVTLRRDHLHSAADALAEVTPGALVVFMGNNPAGRSGLPTGSGTHVALGFPGVGGTMSGDVATYYRIAQQPTVIESLDDSRLQVLAQALTGRGLPTRRVVDMEGWLRYHAVFVAAISAALYRCATDPQRLARDPQTLKLMCRAITQGFRDLHGAGIKGCPRNLALLHTRGLGPVAVGYWGRAMSSPMGELAFAAHARHAQPEMRRLADDVIAGLTAADASDAIRTLLAPIAGD